MTVVEAGGASLAHLFGRLKALECRVRAAVQARQATDPAPDDRFRGLYISDDEVTRLLAAAQPTVPPRTSADAVVARVEAEADAAARSGSDLRLRRLSRSFELSEHDVDVLLVALAPELDARFERLYAYLHDDVSRKRPSTGLALELCPPSGDPDLGRGRFHPRSPLVGGGLLLVEEHDRPFLTRPLRVPDRVVQHLLGNDDPDGLVEWVEATSELDFAETEALVRSLDLGHRLFYVRDGHGAAGYSLVLSALERAGRRAAVVDLRRLETDCNIFELACATVREARLTGAALVVGPVDLLAAAGPGALRALTEAPCSVFLIGTRAWNPEWSQELPLLVEAPTAGVDQRAILWQRALDGARPVDFDPVAATVQFRLTPEQVARAAGAARRLAAARERPLVKDDLQSAARAQNSAGLERLARRIEPRAGWDDLVVPADVATQLRELVARLRHRERVLERWGLGAGSRGQGIACLFAGPSGTGKTMSAEVIGGELGLDLYVIDLSTVVDKYVGETEKNLDRVFAEADGVNGVLLFDEADALFGKRSEVKDARDRWANVEVAYLLQRMELFDGVAVLTTNLRANVDEAFTRRLDAVVDFPLPNEHYRRVLWEKNLGPRLPVADEIDCAFLARSFTLSGGEIHNIVLTAAYLAADEGVAVGMSQIVRAIQREYRKLGRLCVEDEFGPYYSLVSTAA